MADDVAVRLTSGKFVGGQTIHAAGDEFVVAEATADEHPELERVSAGESGGSDNSADDDTPAHEPPFDPGDHTVEELRTIVDADTDDEYSDAEREALVAAERDGENRDSALNVLETSGD